MRVLLQLASLLVTSALACSDGHAEARESKLPSAPPLAAADAPRAPFTAPDAQGWGSAAGLRYLERTLGGGDPSAPLPMLILIHGLGDRPHRSWFGAADAIDVPMRLIMPQAPTPYAGGFAWFEFRVGDNDPHALGRGIVAASAGLARAIAVLRERRSTLGLPIVAGFSQGGMLSYALALRHPELVALSHPISGLLPKPMWPAVKPAGKRFPRIVAMHGDADDVVPIAPDRALVAHLRKLGYEADLREFPGVGHSVSQAMNAHSAQLINEAVRKIALP